MLVSVLVFLNIYLGCGGGGGYVVAGLARAAAREDGEGCDAEGLPRLHAEDPCL